MKWSKRFLLWFGIGCLAGVPPAGAQVIKVACVGDSITEGGGADNPAVNAYPVVLGRLLGAGYQTRNFGVSDTTLLKHGSRPYWKESAFVNATNYAPDIVTIKLGTNDSKPENWKFKHEFADDLRAMIDVFANLPSKPRVFVCLPVPMPAAYAIQFPLHNPGVIKNEIIPLIKQVAKEKGIPTIDLYTALSGRPELFPDNLHPNVAGTAIIAKTLHGALVSR